VGTHFLFPVATLGVTFFILVCQILYLRSDNTLYSDISQVGIKLLGIVFAMGVATGIILPFAFGTNWGNFVEFAGSVFGIHLTIEAVLAFMLESVFLGVLLFGRHKVGKKMYALSAFLVFLGAHFSGFIIISANSWMQTPFHSLKTLSSGIPIPAIDGFHLEQITSAGTQVIQSPAQLVKGAPLHIVMDSVWKVVFNPSAGIRFWHTTSACWLTGAVIFIAISAYLILKKHRIELARKTFSIAIIIGFVTALAQPILGHAHIMETLKWQPVKDAAMEGIFKTQKGAPLYALGWVNEKERKTYALGMPKALSFLESFNLNSEVRGLDDLLAEGNQHLQKNHTDEYKAYSPPVAATFQTFHIMVLIGIILLGVFAFGLWIIKKQKWELPPWIWKVYLFILPLPFIAVETGWITVEIGRQPWIVYGLMKTADGLSPIPSQYVMFSLSIFVLVYISLFVILAKWLPRILKEATE